MRNAISNFLIRYKPIQKVIDKGMPHVMWEIGFTGKGTNSDIIPEPVVKFNRWERLIWWIFEPVTEKYKTMESKRRWAIFRLSCVETLGEDPEDWSKF